MNKKEKEQYTKNIVAAYEKAKQVLLCFPLQDVKAVQKLIDKDINNHNKGNNKMRVWDARKREQDGNATAVDKRLLKKHSSKIKNFRKIMDAGMFYIKLDLLFAIHKEGADFLEAAGLIGKHSGRKAKPEELQKDLEYVMRNKKTIN